MEAHAGTIELACPPSRGTTVTVRFPKLACPAPRVSSPLRVRLRVRSVAAPARRRRQANPGVALALQSAFAERAP
jgi:hypothetical protein